MYLSDEEVEKLTQKMLGWLVDGGHLFIRESCYRPSGEIEMIECIRVGVRVTRNPSMPLCRSRYKRPACTHSEMAYIARFIANSFIILEFLSMSYSKLVS